MGEDNIQKNHILILFLNYLMCKRDIFYKQVFFYKQDVLQYMYILNVWHITMLKVAVCDFLACAYEKMHNSWTSLSFKIFIYLLITRISFFKCTTAPTLHK